MNKRQGLFPDLSHKSRAREEEGRGEWRVKSRDLGKTVDS